MDTLIIMLLIGSSIWVLVDAKAIGVKKGQLQGIANMGAGTWFIACLLLWIVGFPLYLAKRSELKKINEKEKGASIGATVGIAIVAVVLGLIFMGGAQANIEESAAPVVTQIIHEQLFSDVSCVGVTINEEPTENFYRATAFLDNGNEIQITIQDQGDNIFVNILNQ